MENYIRVNGTGNAWPTFIGEEHPFYWDGQPESMANVSFSVFGTDGKEFYPDKVRWSLLIDAGHGTVQQIIKNENRIPVTLLLTHHHLDHTLAIDWVIQSYWFKHDKKKKYPVYASPLCWKYTVAAYPHLEGMVELRELLPGEQIEVTEIPGLKLSAYPVYHGPRAYGAMMLVVEFENGRKVIFTGDCLCPLLRKQDLKKIEGAKYLFVDANNRFSYPMSNHWSITSCMPESHDRSKLLADWEKELDIANLIKTHKSEIGQPAIDNYFAEFENDIKNGMELYFSIFDFIKEIKAQNTGLVHYGGIEDEKYYDQQKLSKSQLNKWLNELMLKEKVIHEVFIPQSVEYFSV